MTQAGTVPRIFAVILAAGESRRYGRPKQLEQLAGETLVARASRTAQLACGQDLLLVVGNEAEQVARAAAAQAPEVLLNERYRHGMGTSLACATRHLANRADALLVILADQPCIPATHLSALKAAWSLRDNEIVATTFDETPGPPVLLPRATFPELEKLSGDRGARHLFTDPRFVLRTIELADAGIDIDTPADLDELAQGSG